MFIQFNVKKRYLLIESIDSNIDIKSVLLNVFSKINLPKIKQRHSRKKKKVNSAEHENDTREYN